MAHSPRSLRHEYELYIDLEIENYKDSVPRRVVLGIGDEAVASLQAQQQLALTEILLCAEVDRIIRGRLGLPSYVTWRRRRLKVLAEYVKPERWGLRPDGAIAQTLTTAGDGHVLVAGAREEGPALYLAANGCAVTALDPAELVVERVISTDAEVGLTGRIRGLVGDLSTWTPDMPLDAVVCASSAFGGLSGAERSRAITQLQNATNAGGLHVLETGTDGMWALTREELEVAYDGWHLSIERDARRPDTILARKQVA